MQLKQYQNYLFEMSQNVKFKVKEFQWFEMETKVRQIIQQVLGPLQKRILENSSIINRLKFNQGEDEKKIQQITLMIQNDPKVFETGIFASVDRKFEEEAKRIEELSRQIDEQNKYVDQKFKILDIRMQESSQVLQNVASLRERVSKEIEIQNENINTVRLNIEKMINDLNSDIRATRKQQQDNMEACEKADYQLSERILINSEDIKQNKQILESHKQLHKEEACKLEEHNEVIKRYGEQIQVLQQSKSMTKKLNDYVKDLQNQLRMTQFKLQTVSPLITQSQISDCLYNVLPQKLKRRIAIHQYKKYFKLNREVLQKNYKEIQSKFNGLQLLEEMQKKNTKEIVQLKRKKLLSMGIDIDHLTYEQRQRYYNQIVLEDTIEDDDEEVKVTAKADEKQILSIVNKHFADFLSNTSQKVGIELEDSKKYLYGMEEQIRHEISSFEKRILETKKECETFHSEQILDNKSLEESIKSTIKTFDSVLNENNKINQIQRSFYNFCSLVNHLQIQDQIDKQNISLMGINQNSQDSALVNRNRNSIIELQKKCFSCCGYPASTLSAFKMACLAYNPSSIIIDSKQYKREELLSITTGLLQKIKQNFVNPQEFDHNNIDLGYTRKIYKQEGQKNLFGNQEIKNKFLDTQNDSTGKKTSGTKFRKSKKMTGYSFHKYQSRSTAKNTTGIKDQMVTASIIFNDLKRKNLTFLN